MDSIAIPQAPQQQQKTLWHRPGKNEACKDILVLCDAQHQDALRMGLPASPEHMQLFTTAAQQAGITVDDFSFLALCPPVPERDLKSAKRKWEHVEKFALGVHDYLHRWKPKIVVAMGEVANRVLKGSAVKITKQRGLIYETASGQKVYPVLSPGFVLRIPEHVNTFNADMMQLGKLKRGAYDPTALQAMEVDYQWCTDLSDWMEDRPKALAVDTETTGLQWYRDEVVPLTVQLCDKAGRVRVCPVHWGYWPHLEEDNREKLLSQIKDLLEDPNIVKLAHNVAYDHKIILKLGINTQGWKHDTMLMAFNVDENMMSKGLDDCIRIFVPDMAGYADAFNDKYDKSKMIEVPYDDMLEYAGGDPDAVWRLAATLYPIIASDPQQHKCYTSIQMPGILTFAKRLERYGLLIDQDALHQLGEEVDVWQREQMGKLVRQVPGAVRRKHLDKGLKFSRPDFTRDVLFGKDGFGLEAKVYTATTRDLEPDDRIASTSSKLHLPYFINRQDHVSDFITDLIEFQKTTSIKNTFIGNKEMKKGFWKYIGPDGRIHPNYVLSRTNTGRSASSDPNGQNFPKRNKLWAKKFLNIFTASPGYYYVAADLSQIELRIAAWESMDPTMLQIFNSGGDIHASTAASTMRMAMDVFDAMEEDERKLQRFRAKAVNFGFIYGMSAPGFQTYAKTDYGIDYTIDQSEDTRNIFFNQFGGLEPWHERRKQSARKNGMVRALHGSVRHLPSIWSNDNFIRSMAERQAVNAPVQRLGSDLGVIAFTRLSHQVHPEIMRPVAFIHDQVVTEVRNDVPVMEAANWLTWVMENPPLEDWFGITPPLPTPADPEYGERLGSLEELKMTAVKPTWWNDDEEAVQKLFLQTV